ncbi:hypothetical protein [Yersinia ruckeri]|uniref:hypothetical protein n=1 Tax=Yersinia ruckeri TaxID=29486 RepID=UPI002237EEF0|nr:hypothetical protein [Yersinia ruckeri]MCW6598809.1 hypothetical protein [Yersinia ruckeri]
MRLKKYEVLRDYNGFVAGDIVYDMPYPDYGVSGDDTRNTGHQHVSVTHHADGGYPGTSVPVRVLKELDTVEVELDTVKAEEQKTRQEAQLTSFKEQYGGGVVSGRNPPNLSNTHIRTHKP